MKRLLIALTTMMSFGVMAQNMDGLVVIEFNAGFNDANKYTSLNNLSGARLYRIDIEKNPSFKTKYNIKSLPTIILFRDGDEQWRWTAGLDMRIHTHWREMQDAINRF